MALSIGQQAPGFKLVDKERKEHSLEEFRGKNVVLFFFPMAWTGTCTKEMCAVEEDYKRYADLNAVTIGISVDTLFALKHFGDDYHLDHVLLLSDFNKETVRAYDVVHHDFICGYKDVAKRCTFVIDNEGIIRFIEILPSPGDFPNLDAIKEALAAL